MTYDMREVCVYIGELVLRQSPGSSLPVVHVQHTQGGNHLVMPEEGQVRAVLEDFGQLQTGSAGSPEMKSVKSFEVRPRSYFLYLETPEKFLLALLQFILIYFLFFFCLSNII